jgi:hypothetical protein
MADDDLELETDYAAADDAPAESAVARIGYEKKLNEQERKELEASKFWAQVFAHPVGRREMWEVLQSSHTFEERFACGPNGFPQVEATWFHAGEQAFGQRLFLSWQRFNPDGVLLMLQEHDPRFAKPKQPKRRRTKQ